MAHCGVHVPLQECRLHDLHPGKKRVIQMIQFINPGLCCNFLNIYLKRFPPQAKCNWSNGLYTAGAGGQAAGREEEEGGL